MDDLVKIYDEVFDYNGDIKPCGREKCKNLILAFEEISNTKGKFGDANTGMMNTEAIKEYAYSIM